MLNTLVLRTREIRRGKMHVRCEVVDGVDALPHFVEGGSAQAEAGFADVSGHDADARRERLIPDLGLLQGGAQALQSVVAVGAPDQAVHHQIGVVPQQVAQHEPAHETGRPGQ